MRIIGLLLACTPFFLIGVGYYYDYKQNPKQFTSDIKGGALYMLGILAIVLLEKILFDIGTLYIILQIAFLIILSLWIKYAVQKEK